MQNSNLVNINTKHSIPFFQHKKKVNQIKDLPCYNYSFSIAILTGMLVIFTFVLSSNLFFSNA